MMFGFLTRKKKEAEAEQERAAQEAEDRRVAAEHARRRAEASRRVLDNLREARAERQAQDAAEDEACKTIGLSQANTDTEVRKVRRRHSEIISNVLTPKNGKSVQELAMEELERQEREREEQRA